MGVVRAEGDILTNAGIDSSKPGGITVPGQPSTQYRLRVKGQKARYLKASEVAKTRAAITHGKWLKQLSASGSECKPNWIDWQPRQQN